MNHLISSAKTDMADKVFHYHEETKHHFHRYARASGYMDWKNQPDPFRRYDDCQRIQLPMGQIDPETAYAALFDQRAMQPENFDIKGISGFLALSLGLSAWKMAGASKWSLRINPSSGNLHPTEAHIIFPKDGPCPAGIYHYSPLLHSLEQRAVLSKTLIEKFISRLSSEGFFIALTSIFWRESWKYGERAYRYCQLDVGHAMAALSYSARLHGWKVTGLNGLSDSQIGAILGLDKVSWTSDDDREHPDMICFIGPNIVDSGMGGIIAKMQSDFSSLDFIGEPNRLSGTSVQWKAIDQVNVYAAKPPTCEATIILPKSSRTVADFVTLPAAAVIRKRRSAVGFDGETMMPRKSFLSILNRTLPTSECPPFDLLGILPSIHLLIFLHRVEGFSPGLYFLIRSGNHLNQLNGSMSSSFLWKQVSPDIPLFLLDEKQIADEAVRISCHQDIAGDGCFSLGMIANFRITVQEASYRYRHLFWEAGMIGQALYLEAEAQGYRGTGIGCFFDDAVHQLMGLSDNTFQSLYHFTIGAPLDDKRLVTLPAYHHLTSFKRD